MESIIFSVSIGPVNRGFCLSVSSHRNRAARSIVFSDFGQWMSGVVLKKRAGAEHHCVIPFPTIVLRDGSVKQGRPVDDWGAHAKNHNHEV
ncbi:hypothetical protein [Endozoicomonas euniceicola]|uniref:Uncharacterized protein n=1 Tax=Endozoicomonas euniceicola TaxID=1234143 RepID=A0ABY6GTW1_9GAMM|nr:hypothetical protein [Endozoicomonas euniceicola]UYM16007.1 hypothetical protein NX720_24885 [Endozoicomonas euniceicola]